MSALHVVGAPNNLTIFLEENLISERWVPPTLVNLYRVYWQTLVPLNRLSLITWKTFPIRRKEAKRNSTCHLKTLNTITGKDFLKVRVGFQESKLCNFCTQGPKSSRSWMTQWKTVVTFWVPRGTNQSSSPLILGSERCRGDMVRGIRFANSVSMEKQARVFPGFPLWHYILCSYTWYFKTGQYPGIGALLPQGFFKQNHR